MSDRKETEEERIRREGDGLDAEILADFENETMESVGGDFDEEGGELADEAVNVGDYDDDEAAEMIGSSEPSGPDTSTRRYARHTGPVYCGALSKNESLFLSGSGEDTAHLWSAKDCGESFSVVLKGPHNESVVSCGFSVDGSYCSTAALDGTICVWNAKTGELVHSPEGPGGEISFIQWHPRGSALLAGASDGSAWLWEVEKSQYKFVQVFQGDSACTSGCFTVTGNSVLLGYESGEVACWNPSTGAKPLSFSGHGWLDGPCNALVMQNLVDSSSSSAAASVFCAGGMDGTARVASLSSGKILTTFEHDKSKSDDDPNASVEAVAFSSVMPWLATGATDGTVKIWDLDAGAPRGSALQCRGGVIKIDWVTNAPHLLCVSTTQGVAHVFDVRTGGAPLRTFEGHKGMVLDIVPTKDELYTCGDDGLVRVYAL